MNNKDTGGAYVATITCSHCGKVVSPSIPMAEPGQLFVVRAWVECPECIEKHKPDPRISALEAENAALKAQLAAQNVRANERIADALKDRADMIDRAVAAETLLESANARAEAAVTALRQVEWAWVSFGSGSYYQVCAWCRGLKSEGHKPDCTRQAALEGGSEGKNV